MTGNGGTPQSAALTQGKQVLLRNATPRDAKRFCALMNESKKMHGVWVQPPLTPLEFAGYLDRVRLGDCARMLVCRQEDGDIVGAFDLTQIVRGALYSATLGYYATVRHAGQGHMCEGLQLTLRYAFRHLKLHRVEANIQPLNTRSKKLVAGAGFRLEGLSLRFLKIAGRWRDHERWALLAEEWKPRL